MKSWQQFVSIAGTWLRENPAMARVLGVMAIILVAFSVLGSGNWWSKNSVALFDSRNLSKDEIGLMQVAFGKSGLNDYEVKQNQIVVPKTMRAEYLKSLADHGAVPLDLNTTLDSEDSFGFLQTRAQRRTRQLERKKQTIRDMVMQLRFVQRAIVDYDETSGATPFDQMQRTAIVNVTPAASRGLEVSEVKAIRDTVCGAVAGLQPENITIIDTFASKSHTGRSEQAGGQIQPHTRSKMQAERKYEEKIRSALTAYPGIRVNVEVTVDPVIRRIRDERSIDDDSVVVARTIQKESLDQVPRTRAQNTSNSFEIGANGQAKIRQWQLPTERATETTESISSGSYETTETVGPVVTKVNVSIGVPERCVHYLADRDSESDAQPNQEQIRRQYKQVMEWLGNDIRAKVGPLIPRGNIDDLNSQIVVTMDREIRLDEPLPTSRAQEWLSSNWSILAVLTLGFWAFLFIRSGRAGHPDGRRPANAQSESHEQAGSGEPQATVPMQTANPTFPASSNSIDSFLQQARQDDSNLENKENAASQQDMRSQLDQWCRENPDTAAATIRQWLEKAG